MDRATQEVIAVYMCGDQASVAAVENLSRRWRPGALWHLRRAIAQALLTIKVNEGQALRFWHEVNKYWVAAGFRASAVPDPYDMTYQQILAEVYTDIAATNTRQDYQRYEAGCQRMRENRSA